MHRMLALSLLLVLALAVPAAAAPKSPEYEVGIATRSRPNLRTRGSPASRVTSTAPW